jgi:hypothetical protein
MTATYEASLLRLRPIMMTALVCIGCCRQRCPPIGSDSETVYDRDRRWPGLAPALSISWPPSYALVARSDDVLKV